MPHPFFLLLLCLSSAYRIVAVRCRKFPAWCEQRQHLYSTLGSFNSSSGARCPAYDVRDNLPSARQNRLKNGKLWWIQKIKGHFRPPVGAVKNRTA